MSIERETIDVLEAIATTRSMRRMKPDPIPDDIIRSILESAVRAPSGSNQQAWSFIVIRDPGVKQQIQQLYHAAWQQYSTARTSSIQSLGPGEQQTATRVHSSATHLAEHMHEAPVLIMCCIRGTESFTLGSSIYPAVQNLMLAARAYGIGSTLTTIHRGRDADVKAILNIPDDVHTAALIPLGYPTGRWGEGKRKPLEEVVFADRFGDRLYQ
jgi:nitroreductase